MEKLESNKYMKTLLEERKRSWYILSLKNEMF